jgi:hypothetical protein
MISIDHTGEMGSLQLKIKKEKHSVQGSLYFAG